MGILLTLSFKLKSQSTKNSVKSRNDNVHKDHVAVRKSEAQSDSEERGP